MTQNRCYLHEPQHLDCLDTPVELGADLTEYTIKEWFVQTDEEFIEEVQAIYEKKKSTMKSLFQESQIEEEKCEEISQYARIHSQANVFNSNSILNFKAIKKNPQIQYCSCGCKRATGQALPLFTNQQKLTFLGPGVILLFFFLRNTKAVVMFMLASYGFFAILSNMLSPQKIEFIGCEEKSNDLEKYICYINIISSFNLKSSGLMRNLQLWIGMLAALFWFFGIKLIEFLGEKKNQEIDDLLDSASDYTIRIQNLPFGKVNEHELIEYLDELWKCRNEDRTDEGSSNEDNASQVFPNLNLRSIQIIYNMSQCRKILTQIQELSIQIVGLLENQKNVRPENVTQYRNKKQRFLSKFKEIQNFRQNFKNQAEFRKTLSTTCALVYFNQSDIQSEFVKKFQKTKKFNPLSSLCNKEKSYFYQNHQIIFTRAPQPSDFYWPNCQIKFSYFRYVFIWIVTIIILYAAYAFVSYIQTIDQVKQSALIMVSVIIQIFNRIIWYSLSFLVIFEYHNTKTDEIVSLMKKSIFAQIINVIFAPMIGKFLNNKPLYGSNSVSLNALFYQFVMFFMMVIFYVINPLYYLKLIIIHIKQLRNKMIRILCQVVGEIDTVDQIRPVYTFYEGPPFPVAGAYVYMATAITHSLFYCHLQPIILLVLVGNMSGFYLIMKYLLFRRCKIPELTDVQIFDIGIGSISYGTFFYSIGSILFIILQKYDQNRMNQLDITELIPSSVCLIIWIILSVNPFSVTDKIIKLIYQLFAFETNFSKPQQTEAQKKQQTMQLLGKLLVAALDNKEEIDALMCQRKQSYYKNSNAQKLFNFQAQIKEIADEDSALRTRELQKFCEHFCKKQSIRIQNIEQNTTKMTGNQEGDRNSREDDLTQMILIPATQLRRKVQTQIVNNPDSRNDRYKSNIQNLMHCTYEPSLFMEMENFRQSNLKQSILQIALQKNKEKQICWKQPQQQKEKIQNFDYS